LVVVPFTESNPARQRAAYPQLWLAVDHRRVEDIRAEWRPVWMPLGESSAGASTGSA
jgi:hypothetical protein